MTTSRQVRFYSRGIEVVADLYFPPANSTDRKRAAIIVGHPGTGIKEQASGLYARRLAEEGFITLAFDAAYQGQSGGEPRNLEDPYQRAEDFKSAVTFLSLLDGEVDPERIGLVGICASGGYGIFAAQTDVRIKAVAGVVAMCTGAQTRAGMQDASGVMDPQIIHQSLQFSGQARVAEARGAKGVMINIADIFEEARDYYRTPRGHHANCSNEQLARSVELMLTYDSFAFIDWISPRPLLMIIASVPQKAFNTGPYGRRAYERAREPKELFVVEGKKHLDLYDDTSQSVPKLTDFMNQWLCV